MKRWWLAAFAALTFASAVPAQAATTDWVQSTVWVNGPAGPLSRFNDEWFEWEPYPTETHGIPVDEPAPAPPSPTEVSLGPLIHVDQTKDNCGPASIAEVLRYYGITRSQQEVQAILRPNNPYGMTTDGVAPYARGIGMRAVVSSRGSEATLKRLIDRGLPVIVEDLLSSDNPQWHYRAIEGYDDGLGQFLAADPYFGPRYAIDYAEFQQLWQPTGRVFIVLYAPDRQTDVDAALA